MKQEIKIPKGTEKISIEQIDNRIVIELIPKFEFKDGDIVFEDGRVMIVKSLPNKYHVNLNIVSGDFYFDSSYGLDFSGPTFRYATDAEKQKLFDTLAKDGKRWNAEKKCIEDLPKEPKIGKLCIFWDFACKYSSIRLFKKMEDGRYVDSTGGQWHNCIPFESEDQFIEHIKILN